MMSSEREKPSVTPFTMFATSAAHQAVHRLGALLVAVAVHDHLARGDLDPAVRRDGLLELALGTLHAHPSFGDVDFDALAERNGLSADSGHGYQTLASSSPPTPALRACDVGQHTARCREDGDSEPAADLRDLLGPHVDAAARARDPLDALDDGLVVRAVADLDREGRLLRVGLVAEAGDVAVLVQDARDLGLQLRLGHRDLGQASAAAVADAREHVGDGIGH